MEKAADGSYLREVKMPCGIVDTIRVKNDAEYERRRIEATEQHARSGCTACRLLPPGGR
jgi:hypothetical protein